MESNLLSEEDFEILPTPAESRPSPSISLGSHLPIPLIPSPSLSIFPELYNKVPSGVTFPSVGSHLADPGVSGSPVGDGKRLVSRSKTAVPRRERDRINNVTQKEEAMELAGVTRWKVYQVIAEALEAVKVTEKIVNGVRVVEEEPNIARRQWGAEKALQVLGDMIEHKQVEYGIADSTLAALKRLSVAELRARAQAILDGRAKAVDVAANIAPVEDATVMGVTPKGD